MKKSMFDYMQDKQIEPAAEVIPEMKYPADEVCNFPFCECPSRDRRNFPLCQQGRAIVEPAAVVSPELELCFGKGELIVTTGNYGESPCVFIRKAASPGAVGEDIAPSEHVPTDKLAPGETVLLFPSAEHAQSVADALCGIAPAPSEQEPSGWKYKDFAGFWCYTEDKAIADDFAEKGVLVVALYELPATDRKECM